MKRLRRFSSYTVVGFLIALALAELGGYVGNVLTRRKAEILLGAVRQLRVGESTLSTTENIRTEFGARRLNVSPVVGSAPEQRFQIFLGNYSLNNLKLKFPGLWRFGLRPSGVEVEFRYQEQKLVSAVYMVDTPVFTSYGEPVELVAGTEVGEGRGVEPQENFRPVYRIRPSLLVGKAYEVRLGSLLGSGATKEERSAAFDFDLSCISTFRGCEAFCQIMPSVWREQRVRTRTMSHPWSKSF